MAPTPLHHNSPSIVAAIALLCAAVAFGLVACQPSEHTLQGAEGEYCNDDDNDCRDGLVCEDFVCTPVSEEPTYEDEVCDEICERLDDCQAPIDSCSSLCVNTVSGWGMDAIDDFRQCFIDDLSCSELQDSEDPPQTCYDQIPLDEQRSQICQDLEDATRSCEASPERIESLEPSCRAQARTAGSDDWDEVENCSEFVDGDSCDELDECLDDTFDLESD